MWTGSCRGNRCGSFGAAIEGPELGLRVTRGEPQLQLEPPARQLNRLATCNLRICCAMCAAWHVSA